MNTIPDLRAYIKRADEVIQWLFWTLFRFVVFLFASSALVYHVRTRTGIALPDFGLSVVASSWVWGFLFLPLFVVGMVVLTLVLTVTVAAIYLLVKAIPHIPALIRAIRDVHAEQRHQTENDD